MRFKCRFLKKKFLLLLITLGIGSALYANDELKSLADSLRRMIDEKPLFIQQKEQRINRIKCLLKGSGLTLEQKYKINFQLCNEYKKFVVDSAIHYVDQNLEIARKLNNRDLKNQSSLQLSLLYSMCGRYRDAELILEKIKTSELSKDLLSVYSTKMNQSGFGGPGIRLRSGNHQGPFHSPAAYLPTCVIHTQIQRIKNGMPGGLACRYIYRAALS